MSYKTNELNIMEPIDERVRDLLDPSNRKSINDFVSFNHGIRYRTKVSKCIYAFWIDNDDLNIQRLNRKLNIVGPGKRLLSMEWNWNLQEKWILIYVGKTRDLKQRISQHMKLGTPTWNHNENGTLNRLTTSCQVRSGLEHLLKGSNLNCLELVRSSIGLTVIEIEDFEERFYLEDLAIGLGRPWFNVDSER